jgi:hypothetical protein
MVFPVLFILVPVPVWLGVLLSGFIAQLSAA